jgi:acyl-coenzyme A synthetase/AMP-(fatty) acid ligase
MSELLDGPVGSGRLNFVRDVVDAHVRQRPERAALTHIDAYGVIERLSFADVARRASRWANVLTEAEIGPGERALLSSRSRLWPSHRASSGDSECRH